MKKLMLVPGLLSMLLGSAAAACGDDDEDDKKAEIMAPGVDVSVKNLTGAAGASSASSSEK